MTDPNGPVLTGFAVVTSDNYFVGIWKSRESAEKMLNRSPSAKGERIVEMAEVIHFDD
jgi:hypothetical protein